LEVDVSKCGGVDENVTELNLFDINCNIQGALWNVYSEVEVVLDELHVDGHFFLGRCGLNPESNTHRSIEGHSAVILSDREVANFVKIVLKVDRFVGAIVFEHSWDEDTDA